MTLLELLVAMAIAAALAAIAFSSYRQHTLRAYRTEAKSALLRLQAEQERFYTRNGNRYTDDLTRLGYARAADVPTTGGRYLLRVDDDADAHNFTARAVAEGVMQRDAECLVFSIDARGRRAAAPDPRGRCW